MTAVVQALGGVRSRLALVFVAAAGVMLAVSIGVFAYWTSSGTGTASAGIGTLAAPDHVTATNAPPGSGTVHVTWDGVDAPLGTVDGYYVVRNDGSGATAACGTSRSVLTSATSCSDENVPNGTYAYRVTVVYRSWTAESDESNSLTVVNDTTAPTVVSITRDDPSPTNAASVHWTVTFSEDVTGVDASDFGFSGSGAAGASVTGVTGSGDEYTVTASVGVDGVLRLDLVDDDSIKDAANNRLGGTGMGNGSFTTGQAYTVDRTAPSVSSVTRAGANPTNAANVSWTVSFSEGVTGVDAGDFTLTASGLGGTLAVGTVTQVDAQTYTVSASTGAGTPGGSGTLRLDVVDDDSIADALGNKLGGTGAGNGNFTTGQAYTVDKTAPTVSSIDRSGTSPTNAGPLTWQVVFSEPVANVGVSSFSLATANVAGASPSVSAVTAVGGAPATTWNVSVSTAGTTGQNNGSIRLDLSSVGAIQDPATNGLANTLTGQAYAFDTTQPTVSSINRTGTNPANAGPLTWQVTFSEPVSNVAVANFGVTTQNTGGSAPTVSSVTPSGSAPTATWTVSVSTAGTTGANDGSIRLDLSTVGTIRDVATNLLAATFTGGQAYTYDTTPPTVSSIARSGASPTNAGSVAWTVTFSEGVSGVNAADFALAASGVSGASITSVTGTGPYMVTANTGSGSGSIGLDLVDDDSIQDAATNRLGGTGTGNGNATGEVFTIDKTPPTVSSMNRVTASPTNAASVQWTVTFSESVTGVAAGNFTLVNGGLGGSPAVTGVSGSGTTWTVTASTGTGSGTLGLNLTSAGSIQDTVGNGLAGTIPFTGQVYTVDRTAPTVSSINRLTASPTNASFVQWTVTLSETVTGVDTADFTLVTPGVSGAAITNVAGTGPYTVTASTGTGDGTVGLNLVDDDSIQDLATNRLGGTGAGNGNSTGQVYAIDKTAPTVTNVTLNNSGTLGQANDNDTVVVTFSEVMDATTFCSTWSNGSTQNVAGGNQVTVTITDNGSDDLLTVSWNTCGAGGSHFGTVHLNANYVSATRTFGGNNNADRSEVTWNPATRQFTVQLGAPSGATLTGVAASIPSFSGTDSAVKDSAGNSIGAGPYPGTSSRF
jgi:hypothetical protein